MFPARAQNTCICMGSGNTKAELVFTGAVQAHVVGYKVVDDASEINPLYEPVSGWDRTERLLLLQTCRRIIHHNQDQATFTIIMR